MVFRCVDTVLDNDDGPLSRPDSPFLCNGAVLAEPILESPFLCNEAKSMELWYFRARWDSRVRRRGRRMSLKEAVWGGGWKVVGSGDGWKRFEKRKGAGWDFLVRLIDRRRSHK